ncbi:glycosyltransferase family A protein [Phaeobacter gallaeciensis]|uniref:glycosyltransferase family 2 protein n=1 Tax=Phaeobacter gallaeciensis TaxID=60890 RepID=UPI00238090E3|nr:glycosyltransferase family A protein [Phaeobacter gallaeciensis]MDE4276394.1 glycosyltransferase family A protein [Phaeobacter gallaeciensis]MDE4301627.1 glycosyltransferase family A protein [Phaeobacter gallaeciensis]MDE5186782.1 glycosyltransferase family A protein [Phaeobacter gallaeciensis]
MKLSLVIPVRNDSEGLTRLLAQVAELALFDAVLVCDDASDPPCRPADLGFDEAALGITYLRSEEQRGAGHARNMGLDAVQTDHVLFFDSDDLLAPPLVTLWQDLQTQAAPFDFCLFRHVDSRERALGRRGPMEADQRLWQGCGLLGEIPQEVGPDQAVQIVQIAAYPWNKIYRTGFLRDENIRCTEIPVHNDIELHWSGFLKARRILASGALCCEHFVAAQGNRLTNRRSADRLEVFRALAPLHRVLRESGREPEFLLAMTGFYTRLFDWILGTLEEQYHAEFFRRISAFLLAQHDDISMALIAARDPALAQRINDHIRRGWG